MSGSIEVARLSDEEMVLGVSSWQGAVEEQRVANDNYHALAKSAIYREREKSHQAYEVYQAASRNADVLFRTVFPSIQRRPGTYPLTDLRFHQTDFKHYDGTYSDGIFPDFYYLHVVRVNDYSFLIHHYSEAIQVVKNNGETPTIDIEEGRAPLIHLPDQHPVQVDVGFSNWRFFKATWNVDVPETPTFVRFLPDLKTEKAWEGFQSQGEIRLQTVTRPNIGKYWPSR